MAWSVLLACIADNHIGRISRKKTLKEQWDLLLTEHEPNTDLVHVDKRQVLGEIRCTAGGDIRVHFDSFLSCYGELIAAGGSIADSDLIQMVIMSMPNEEYRAHIQLVMTTAHLMNTPVTANQLISEITVEYNSRKIMAHAASTTNHQNKALYVAPPHQPNPSRPSSPSCWTCQGNHRQADCPQERGQMPNHNSSWHGRGGGNRGGRGYRRGGGGNCGGGGGN
jgi:uncharacterized membrane protein YgcG